MRTKTDNSGVTDLCVVFEVKMKDVIIDIGFNDYKSYMTVTDGNFRKPSMYCM